MKNKILRHPFAPVTPLQWFNIPLFHVKYFPPEFAGTLYFILGQGLGDHVNGFRVLIDVQKKFPLASCIVYADLRWKDLVERLEKIEIRWYPKAKDILSKEGTNNPYDFAREEVRREISASMSRSFLAYAHFPMPDRHSRQESTLEATARTIGLSLNPQPRPHIPLHHTDLDWAEQFLKKNNLQKGNYAVISPLSWPNKVWKKEKFSSLIDKIYNELGLRTVITSYPDIGLFTNEGSVCAFDLSLGKLAGILSSAKVYVGLDSGPSHMCAFFDVPMVVLYIERKVIPFEVRTLSPHALLVVESFFDSSVEAPSVQTVFDSVSYVLSAKTHNEKFPKCPGCERRLDHVVGTDSRCIRLMCACGVSLDQNTQGISQKVAKSIEPLLIEEELEPISEELIMNNCFISKKNQLDMTSDVSVFIEDQPLSKEHSPLTPDKVIWGLDSLLYYMAQKEYTPIKCFRSGSEIRLRFSKFVGVDGPVLSFPWGEKIIRTTGSRYLQWFSFSRWADPKILVGIVKSMSELGFPRKERFLCSLIAFKAEPSFRSFRWIFKSLM